LKNLINMSEDFYKEPLDFAEEGKFEFKASSTLIESGEYFPDQRRLIINFVRGGSYQYFNVPPEDYHSMVNAPSVGKAFNSTIRGNYDFEKL